MRRPASDRIALDRAFGRGFHVRPQFPIALDDASEPEPDIAVVRGQIEDYLDTHPTFPVLIVEVADSSLAQDRHRKARLYARAGVADYWIVKLRAGVLEVYRDPERTATGRWRYATVRVLKPGAVVSPIAALARGSASPTCSPRRLLKRPMLRCAPVARSTYRVRLACDLRATPRNWTF
jgi:hypothetical protein